MGLFKKKIDYSMFCMNFDKILMPLYSNVKVQINLLMLKEFIIYSVNLLPLICCLFHTSIYEIIIYEFKGYKSSMAS